MPFPSQLLAHTITVYAPTVTRDAAGGEVVEYAVRQSGVAALINVASASEQERFARRNIIVSHTIVIQQTNLVQQGDRVDGYDADGTLIGTFDVQGIRAQPGVPFIDMNGHCYLSCSQQLP